MKKGKDSHRFSNTISKGIKKQNDISNNDVLSDSKSISTLAGLSALFSSIYAFPAFYGNTTPYNDFQISVLFIFGFIILILTIACVYYLVPIFNDIKYSYEELEWKEISSYLVLIPFAIFSIGLGIAVITAFHPTPGFSLCLFMVFSIPLIGFIALIILLKKNQFRNTHNKIYFRGKKILVFAFVMSIFMTFITTFPKTIISGVVAGLFIPLGWTAAIILFYIGGIVTPKLSIIKIMKGKNNFPLGFVVLMSATFLISIIFMSNVINTMNETILKIDKSSLNKDRYSEYYIFEITIVNEGGKYASGNISVAFDESDYNDPQLTIIDSTNRIDGFGKWKVFFRTHNPDGFTVILLHNDEEKDHMVIYTGCADIIPITFITVIAAVLKRRRVIEYDPGLQTAKPN